MVTITNEEYIATMFEIGFERIDPLLYTFTIGELLLNEEARDTLEFISGQPNQVFSYYVEYKNGVYSLKDGRTIDTNISPVEGVNIPLIRALKPNAILKEYLNTLDFKKVIDKKIKSLEKAGYQNISYFLCPKEEYIRKSIKTKR